MLLQCAAMCSRYEFDVHARDLASGDLFDRFGLSSMPFGDSPPGPLIRPTDRAMIIAGGDGGRRRARMQEWGLSVSWDSKPLINARAETLEDKPTFRPLLRNRCLVPATAYFEWRREGCRRLKNRIAPEDNGLFAFAGLVDGGRFTIITCAPGPAIAHVHDRMPVILARNGEAAWLDPGLPFVRVKPLLVPFPAMAADEDAPPDRQPDLFG